jgi:hypothetical protein
MQEFLDRIVGVVGRNALNKAIAAIPPIGSVVIPRAIVSWLSVISKVGFEGEIPGMEQSYLTLTKAEDEKLTGAMTIGGQMYTFEGADLLHVAASLGVALGIDLEPIDENLRNKDLTKLGKSIDLLVKSEFIKQAKLTKANDDSTAAAPPNEQREAKEQAIPLTPVKQPAVNAKSSNTGPTQKPNLALGQGQKAVKVTKAEAGKVCSECGSQLFKSEKFTGCMCLTGLSKNVKTESTPDGFLLTFKAISEDELLTLINIIKD